MAKGDLLFFTADLRRVVEAHEYRMLEEIDKINGDRLLNTTVDDLADYFGQEYRIDAPGLIEDQISVDQKEAKIDVSGDSRRLIFDRSKPFYLTGTEVTFYVPFQGDAQLFSCKPSSFTLNPPQGVVQGNELVLSYQRLDHDAAAIKTEFERDLQEIRKWLSWIASDVAPFNASVRTKARERIEARRQKILKDHGVVAALGFPLRRRVNAPQTYVVPAVRRKPAIAKLASTAKPSVPEPALEMEEYEHILSVIMNMVAVMERSPRAFRGMDEPALRDHFLVQLNGQYEGQASGETFNYEGKTDILIRVEGKNIFIAECKFWDGPESLKKAVTQLLGYACWRDTKTALLIFNRRKNFTTVLQKTPEVVKAHANFKRQLDYKSETGFRFVLHHRDDKERELILTVLAFEVPA